MAIRAGKNRHTARRVTIGQAERVEVVEYTDVMCSWAWGSEPKLRLLRWRYEDRCDWRLVMGGLVGDRTKNLAAGSTRSPVGTH
jgi:protein-disulfide isomerase-like protein with CxxC motif